MRRGSAHIRSRRAGAAPRGRETAGALDVVLLNQQRRRRIPAARLRRVIQDAARALRVSGEVALVLTSDAPVRRLNARYRHQDEPTDVLSFPGPGGDVGLGDIVISLDTAARNALRFGRTLNDAFVIIDEAQNTTTEQMKMVLTRIGFGSKVVITGDITQIDLPTGRTSGLVEAIAVLSGVKGISFVYFDEKDVVRHKLVQSVIKAYDAYGAAQAPAR